MVAAPVAHAAVAIDPASHHVRHPAGAQVKWLDDGRLHLHHGPIDLLIGVDGAPDAVKQACSVAKDRFDTVLEELVRELAILRRPVDQLSRPQPAGLPRVCGRRPYRMSTAIETKITSRRWRPWLGRWLMKFWQ